MMPKIKTHRGAAKRFKKTARGKVRANHSYHSHILAKKHPKRKRNLRKSMNLSRMDAKRVKRLIPY